MGYRERRIVSGIFWFFIEIAFLIPKGLIRRAEVFHIVPRVIASIGAVILGIGALTSSEYQLRYTCGWGGKEIGERHKAMSDEEFVELGSLVSSAEEYGLAFSDLFDLNI